MMLLILSYVRLTNQSIDSLAWGLYSYLHRPTYALNLAHRFIFRPPPPLPAHSFTCATPPPHCRSLSVAFKGTLCVCACVWYSCKRTTTAHSTTSTICRIILRT